MRNNFQTEQTGRRIFCLGDSNTFGYNPYDFFGNPYPPGVRWTDQLSDAWEMINDGLNGMCVPELRMADAIIDLIRSASPDLLVVMLGTNDILSARSAAETADKMEGFLIRIAQDLNDLPILLVSPPLLQKGEWVSEPMLQESRKLGACYREIADRNHLLFADAGVWELPLVYDGVHLSELGHKIFAAKMREVLASLTGEKMA